jgi:hypothetical protein
VKVRYCDGGSFTGDGADTVRVLLSYASKLFLSSFTGRKYRRHADIECVSSKI